jgi:hypothetical protein
MASATLSPSATSQIPQLLRGEERSLQEWTEHWRLARFFLCLALIVVGAGSFGAAMGAWRAPLQALFCAIKLPLIILLTTLGNGLLNAMLAPLLGLNIPARQTMLAVLLSFTLAGLILGAFSPLLGFLIWNLPPLEVGAESNISAHSVILLTETAMIAFAGVAANVRLAQLLRRLAGGGAEGRRVLVAWLAGNLFLGSQLAWLSRPFVGSPGLPVQFMRDDALHGSFFEALWRALRYMIS